MKVSELISILEKVDPNRIVIMSKDAEGNRFSPFSEISTGSYAADSTWSGEVGLEELAEQGYGEEDVVNGEPAIVLWPVN